MVDFGAKSGKMSSYLYKALINGRKTAGSFCIVLTNFQKGIDKSKKPW